MKLLRKINKLKDKNLMLDQQNREFRKKLVPKYEGK